MAYIIFIAAVLINGATDAAGAITGVVASGMLTLRKASVTAALMNFIGMLIFYCFFPYVSDTIEGMATLDGMGQTGCICVLLSIVIWSGGAWILGIPTSESHGLVAGIAGACAAVGIKTDFFSREWILVYGGVFLSAVLGAFFGGLAAYILRGRGGKKAAVTGCMAASFLHGAQDGQKFLALAVSCSLFHQGIKSAFLCAVVMSIGTLIGGGKIVKKMGSDMTRVTVPSAVASDAGCAAALLIVTALGMPASTTHVKTCSIAGSSRASNEKVDAKLLLSMIIAWITTFPACYMLSFFITKWALEHSL